MAIHHYPDQYCSLRNILRSCLLNDETKIGGTAQKTPYEVLVLRGAFFVYKNKVA